MTITVEQVIIDNAKYVKDSGFTVTVDKRMPTVDISNEDNEGLFFEGHNAELYIQQCIEIADQVPLLTMQQCYDANAKGWIDAL